MISFLGWWFGHWLGWWLGESIDLAPVELELECFLGALWVEDQLVLAGEGNLLAGLLGPEDCDVNWEVAPADDVGELDGLASDWLDPASWLTESWMQVELYFFDDEVLLLLHVIIQWLDIQAPHVLMLILAIFTCLFVVSELLVSVSDFKFELNLVSKEALALLDLGFSFLEFLWLQVLDFFLELLVDLEFVGGRNLLTIEWALALLLQEHGCALGAEYVLAGEGDWLDHDVHADVAFAVVVDGFFYSFRLLGLFNFLRYFLFFGFFDFLNSPLLNFLLNFFHFVLLGLCDFRFFSFLSLKCQ